MDLAGQERAALLPVSEKRYMESLFINENLDCLKSTVSQISRNEEKIPDFSIHPALEPLADTLGQPVMVSGKDGEY